MLHLPASESGVQMQVVAVIDPLSSEAQKLTPLLQVLQVALPTDITVMFNPVPKLTEMPVKRCEHSHMSVHTCTHIC